MSDAVESIAQEDQSLARLARAGDLSAFERLMERHQRPVFQFLLYRCGNRQDAEDVTQTTFLAAYRALGRYDERHSFYTWIFTIARRQCIDLLRRRRPTLPLEEHALPGGEAPPHGIDDTGMELWRLARLHLSAHQLESLWLVYKEDQTLEEAARALGWTKLRMKVTLHRAREKLRRVLASRIQERSTRAPLTTLQPEQL